MKVKPATTPWLRRARWAVGLAALACAGVGLLWVYRSVLAGDVVGALAGAGLCLGVLALELAAGALLRLGGLVLRCAQRLDAIENHVAALEASIDALENALGLPVDLTEVGSGDAERLVAARIERDAFPRLVQPSGGPPRPDTDVPAEAEPTGSTITGQRELDRLVGKEMERLRAEFGELVREEDFAGALRTGERIETLFPDSVLARQFNSIRPHLLRRASGADPQKPASAM